MTKIIINSQTEMSQLARKLANSCEKNQIFGLKGTLGAGKSFFAQEFIRSLQQEGGDILSPTFNIVIPYKTLKSDIHHFDLYRLKDKEELENIEFFEILKSGISLIEWPEIAENYLKTLKNYIEINIIILEDEKREINISNL